MVKHNNQIPNIHCKKKYMQSSRGPLKVRLALNQATRKKARRVKRAAKTGIAPAKKLRPIVRCPTQKYSAKLRLGRGFTLDELKAAGINPKYAMTVGIAVDWRRQNHSEESLERNVARLEEYKSKLVILKKGDAVPEGTVKCTPQPLVKPKEEIEMMAITAEMKDYKAFTTLRVARKETKVEGFRCSVANRKKKD